MNFAAGYFLTNGTSPDVSATPISEYPKTHFLLSSIYSRNMKNSKVEPTFPRSSQETARRRLRQDERNAYRKKTWTKTRLEVCLFTLLTTSGRKEFLCDHCCSQYLSGSFTNPPHHYLTYLLFRIRS